MVMPQAKKDPTKMRMVYTPTEESMREASERVAKQKEERAAAKKAAAEARAQLKAEQAAKQEAVKAARRARNGGSDEADFGTTLVGAKASLGGGRPRLERLAQGTLNRKRKRKLAEEVQLIREEGQAPPPPKPKAKIFSPLALRRLRTGANPNR